MYEAIFDRYKQFILANSKYAPRVVKTATNTSTYFPIITCVLSDSPDNGRTQQNADRNNMNYYTINIYAQDIVNPNKTIASQVVIDELRKLTNEFFGIKLNMRKTLDRPTMNIDTDVNRQTMNYQCIVDNRCVISRY